MKPKLYLVPNNHIDREWTYDAQLTRMLTVKFFEDLLVAFKKIPGFEFVLDSQSVPLEDFLEIFPDKRPELEKLVSARKLWAGPWYTAPDCFYINGESIVRNLLVGHAVANSFGGVSKFGYTPFGWGQVSQLPQIYDGFGIDTAFFYRGADTIGDIYFNWRGADGTAIRCIKYHRTNFFDKVFRPITKGRQPVPWDRELDYSGGEVPVALCDGEHKYEHGFVARGKLGRADIAAALDRFLDEEKGSFPDGMVLGMNGMDTCFPSLDGLLAIERFRRSGRASCEIAYSGLDRFSADLRRASDLAGAELATHSGEMRRFLPGFGGKGKSEVKTTHFYLAAARPRQKSQNARAENLLARTAEPLASIAGILGSAYPKEFLGAAWKLLLKCHPHDTIAGCGVDQIETDMLNRLDQVINISRGVTTMSLQHIVANIDNPDLRPDEFALVIFNPSPTTRKEVVECWLHLPEKPGFRHFAISEKATGKPVRFQILERGEKTDRIFRDLTDTSLFVYGELVRVAAEVEVGGLGYKTLVVRKAPKAQKPAEKPLASGRRMGNAFAETEIRPDGTLDVRDKGTGKLFRGLHYFSDTGDNGDPWVRFVPDRNRAYSTRGKKAKIRILENGPLLARFEIRHEFLIPRGLEKKNYVMEGYYEDAASSPDLVPARIRSVVSLTSASPAIDIRTEIENPSTDHLLQAIFPTGLKSRRVHAESAFDVVERTITPNGDGRDPGLVNGEDPFLRFVDLSYGKVGLAILGDGVRGYEPLGDDKNSLALNLLRAYTSQIVTIYGRKERRPEQRLAQAPGNHKFHYGIFAHAGMWQRGCLSEADRLNCPMIPIQTHRTAGSLPPALSFLELGSPEIGLSAFKAAEKRGGGFILRIFNPSPDPVSAELGLFRTPKKIEALNLNEETLSTKGLKPGRKIPLSLGPKKIATFRLRFAVP